MRLPVVPAAEIAVVAVDLEGIVYEEVPKTFVFVKMVYLLSVVEIVMQRSS